MFLILSGITLTIYSFLEINLLSMVLIFKYKIIYRLNTIKFNLLELPDNYNKRILFVLLICFAINFIFEKCIVGKFFIKTDK